MTIPGMKGPKQSQVESQLLHSALSLQNTLCKLGAGHSTKSQKVSHQCWLNGLAEQVKMRFYF